MERQERRKGKRINRSCTARIRLLHDGTAEEGSVSKWDVVILKNLSVCGMLFSYTKKVNIGATFEFYVSPPSGIESIHCIGQVCRVEEGQAKKISVAQIPVYSVAVSFKDIDPSQLEAIRKICEAY